jgi:hypothetical protein
MRGFRHAFLHLALAALILRGFMPTGWMPNAQTPGESLFVICTMDGPVQAWGGKALPGKDDPRAHETCPFAAAAASSLAPPIDFVRIAAPLLSETAAPRTVVAALPARAPPFSQASSRAPPSLI